MRILRSVLHIKNTNSPFERLLIQGEVVEDYVCPYTVKVYGVMGGVVGPQINSHSEKGMKLSNQMAIKLTKLLRRTNK